MLQECKQIKSTGIKLPTLCFTTRCLGEISEVWIWRQLVGFKQLKPYVLTWKYINRDIFTHSDIPIYILPFDADPENRKGIGRWIYRFRCLQQYNFYTSVGSECRVIKEYLTGLKPDVIICHYGYTALRILQTARQLNIPLVAHFHGIDVSASLRNRWYRTSLLRSLKYFTTIVTSRGTMTAEKAL